MKISKKDLRKLRLKVRNLWRFLNQAALMIASETVYFLHIGSYNGDLLLFSLLLLLH